MSHTDNDLRFSSRDEDIFKNDEDVIQKVKKTDKKDEVARSEGSEVDAGKTWEW